MNNEPFVPIEQLAKHFTVSVSTIRSWVRHRNIPTDTYIKVGNTYRFSVSKVADALRSQESTKNELVEKSEDMQHTLDLDDDL